MPDVAAKPHLASAATGPEQARALRPDLAARTMPTRAALQAAGRADIVRAVRAAGGSLAVAQRLGLRSRRRPVGFWDSTDNLDEVHQSTF